MLPRSLGMGMMMMMMMMWLVYLRFGVIGVCDL